MSFEEVCVWAAARTALMQEGCAIVTKGGHGGGHRLDGMTREVCAEAGRWLLAEFELPRANG